MNKSDPLRVRQRFPCSLSESAVTLLLTLIHHNIQDLGHSCDCMQHGPRLPRTCRLMCCLSTIASPLVQCRCAQPHLAEVSMRLREALLLKQDVRQRQRGCHAGSGSGGGLHGQFQLALCLLHLALHTSHRGCAEPDISDFASELLTSQTAVWLPCLLPLTRGFNGTSALPSSTQASLSVDRNTLCSLPSSMAETAWGRGSRWQASGGHW